MDSGNRNLALEMLEVKRTILINDTFEKDTGDLILECLARAFIQGFPELTIIINCKGGSSTVGIAVYNAIKLCTSSGMKVRGIVISQCYSAAVTVLQACTTREVMPGATMVIHWGSYTLHNTEYDAIMSKNPEWFLAQLIQNGLEMINIFSKRSGLSKQTIRRLCKT